MNGFALILALAVGQQWGTAAGDQFGRTDPRASSRVEGPPVPSWHDYAVRVIVDHGDSQGLGSGTVIGTAADGKRLVLTARHVLGRARSGISVEHRGATYAAQFLAAGTTGDIAAIAADIPGDFADLRIAGSAPSEASMLGFGENGRLHRHSGRLIGYAVPSGDRSPDMRFSFGAEQGDSGGGVFNASGEFAGVVWGSSSATGAMAVSTAKVHEFLGVKVHQTGGKRIVTISPFFIKIRREWDDSSKAVDCTPVRPVAPSQPTSPGPAIAAQPGAQGPPGPAGPAGKDAPAVDLSGLIAATQANAQAIAQLTTQVQAIKAQPPTPASQPIPFLFRIKKPDGTTTPIANLLSQDSSGKPQYTLEIDAAQLAPQTVPVTPIPGK